MMIKLFGTLALTYKLLEPYNVIAIPIVGTAGLDSKMAQFDS